MDPDTRTRMSAHLIEFVDRIWRGGLQILLEGHRQNGLGPEPRLMQGTFGEVQVTAVFEEDAYQMILRQTVDTVQWKVVFCLPRVDWVGLKAIPLTMEPHFDGKRIKTMVKRLILAWPILPDTRQTAFLVSW
ncbi:hypothetical protein EXS71_02870 [Candidatus Uhrbacteria bacterium]|nr:hypothetical protein [Candidatus Uhrbacteria bacterium]